MKGKEIFKLLAGICAIGMVACAEPVSEEQCGGEDILLGISYDVIDVYPLGQTIIIPNHSKETIYIESEEDSWLSYPRSVEPMQKIEITVSPVDNSKREATLFLTCGEATKDITIVQDVVQFEFKKDQIDIPALSDGFYIECESNVNFTIGTDQEGFIADLGENYFFTREVSIFDVLVNRQGYGKLNEERKIKLSAYVLSLDGSAAEERSIASMTIVQEAYRMGFDPDNTTTKTLDVDPEGYEDEIIFHSHGEWEVKYEEKEDRWATLCVNGKELLPEEEIPDADKEKYKPQPAGENIVAQIKVEPNIGEARTTTIYIDSNGRQISVVIRQKAAN